MTGVISKPPRARQNPSMSVIAPMPQATERATPSAAPPWRAVALPIEHGGWSFLIEPLILGLVVAPSAAGGFLAASALAAFLTRHPLKLVALDRRRGVRYPRTDLATRFLAVYAAVAALTFTAALSLSGPAILVPLALGAPAAFLALGRDLQGRGREAAPEIAGALGLGASATAIILAGDGRPVIAWLAWALGAGRAVTAILYVRARVRVDRSVVPETRFALSRPVLLVHAAALIAAMAAATASWLSPFAVCAFALLLFRAAWGLAPGCARIRVKILGVQEVMVGLACLYLFAASLSATSLR